MKSYSYTGIIHAYTDRRKKKLRYSYAHTEPLYLHHYPDDKLISIHERPLADPTGKLTAIMDYEKPLGRLDMGRYGMTEFPFWLAQERYLPLFSERWPMSVESLETIRNEVAHAISALADYHPLNGGPYGTHVGGLVGKDVKNADLLRIYDTIPTWALDMVQEMITGTGPEEFSGLRSTADVRSRAETLHETGQASLFGE